MDSINEEIKKAELEFLLRDIANRMHLASTLIADRDTAVRFNGEISHPIMKLRRRFGMASGNVVKVKPKP